MPRGQRAESGFEQFIDAWVQSLGEALTAGVLASLAAGGTLAPGASAPAGGRRARGASAAGARCVVPGCSRAQTTKGLCAAHYQKAYRLGIDASALKPGQLAKLAEDGRKRNGKKSRAR
jgi:hypothetical protein